MVFISCIGSAITAAIIFDLILLYSGVGLLIITIITHECSFTSSCPPAIFKISYATITFIIKNR